MKYWLMISGYKTSSYEMARRLKDWDPSISALAGPDVQKGDSVLLWRGGKGGGIVAIGKIADTTPVLSSRRIQLEHEDHEGAIDSEEGPARATIDFHKLLLAAPISSDALRTAGCGDVWRRAWSSDAVGGLIPLSMSDYQRRSFVRLADQEQHPTEWPATWNIPPGSVVRRSNLHEVYGGNPRVAAGPSGKTPNVFFFLDPRRSSALALKWGESGLTVPGHGQTDGEPSTENLAMLAHLRRGVPLRGFLTQGPECFYLGEFAVDLRQPVERWVVTGTYRSPYFPKMERDVKTPIFGVRQLSGVQVSIGSTTELFRDAPRVNLSLNPYSDTPANTMIRNLHALMERDPSIAASLGELDEAQLIAAAIQRRRRQADLDELRAVAEDPTSNEGRLQKLVQRMTWIFGGEFLLGTARRNLTVRDQLDVALIRPDGTLHGVELKQASIKKLVTGHRSHLIVGPEVHAAVGQAMNYLRELDEKRHQILADLRIDCRRASMTVVIGHSGLITNGVSSREVDETIRTYNSYLSRVSVVTYDRLIENAQRTLDLASLAE